jgi:hypothetical protein
MGSTLHVVTDAMPAKSFSYEPLAESDPIRLLFLEPGVPGESLL